jgi:hypothetical protein
MDNPPSTITSHARQRDIIIPNLRGEDETELSYLTNLIESSPSLSPT